MTQVLLWLTILVVAILAGDWLAYSIQREDADEEDEMVDA